MTMQFAVHNHLHDINMKEFITNAYPPTVVQLLEHEGPTEQICL